MANVTTETADGLDGYIYGVLMAFLEPTDKRMALIRASVREKVAAIEAEAVANALAALRVAVEGQLIADPTIDGRLVNIVVNQVLALIADAERHGIPEVTP